MNNEFFSGGGGKVNPLWIVGGLSALVVLMLVLCGGGGGAYLLVTTWQAEVAREANERANFDRAAEEMADAMDKFTKGTVTASYAVKKIENMQNVANSIKDYGVCLDEIAYSQIEQMQNAEIIVGELASKATSMTAFQNDPAVRKLQAMGLITQKKVDEQIEG